MKIKLILFLFILSSSPHLIFSQNCGTGGVYKASMQLNGPDIDHTCVGDELAFNITNTIHPITWEVSPHFEILSQDATSILVRTVSPGQWAYVSAKAIDNSDFDYGTNNEFEEGLNQNNGYNCHGYEFAVTKKIPVISDPWVQLEDESSDCLNMFWIRDIYPHLDNTSYNWTAISGGVVVSEVGSEVLVQWVTPSSGTPVPFVFSVEVTNECGATTTINSMIPVPTCSGTGEIPLISSPNPADGILTLEIKTSFADFLNQQPPLKIMRASNGQNYHQNIIVIHQ